MFDRPWVRATAWLRAPDRLFATLLLGSAALITSGCGGEEELVVLDETALATVTDTSLALPPLRYPDGQVTLNDRCPVRQSRLNPRLPAIYVNQHPVGFC